MGIIMVMLPAIVLIIIGEAAWLIRVKKEKRKQEIEGQRLVEALTNLLKSAGS